MLRDDRSNHQESSSFLGNIAFFSVVLRFWHGAPRTFGSTWRTATPPDDTAGRGGPPLRKQRLLGWAELRPWAQLPASPNAKHFQVGLGFLMG